MTWAGANVMGATTSGAWRLLGGSVEYWMECGKWSEWRIPLMAVAHKGLKNRERVA